MKDNKPIKEFKIGRIKASVWANEGQKSVWYTVTVSRLYKEEGNTWQSASSFKREDLLVLCKVLNLTHSWLYEQSADESKARRGRENLERLSREVQTVTAGKTGARHKAANS
jgi:hypothetical protein